MTKSYLLKPKSSFILLARDVRSCWQSVPKRKAQYFSNLLRNIADIHEQRVDKTGASSHRYQRPQIVPFFVKASAQIPQRTKEMEVNDKVLFATSTNRTHGRYLM